MKTSFVFCVLGWLYSLLAAPLHSEFAQRPIKIDFREGLVSEARFISLEELCTRYDAFILDAYGVFWGSSEIGVLPGGAAAMQSLVARGKWVGILSNSTILATKEKEKLQNYGLYEGVHYHFLLTSGEVAKKLFLEHSLPFSTPRHTYFLSSPPHPRFPSQLQIFEGTKYRQTTDLEEADFIYVSIPHLNGIDQEEPEVFREWIKAIGRKLPVVCVNPDRFAMEGAPPRPVVRQGSIAELFTEEQALVYLIGKPSQTLYEVAFQQIPSCIPKERIIMIGDTPETDIRGAHGVGLKAVLITKTGILANLLEKENVFFFIDHLPFSDRPDFLLERLGGGPKEP